MRRVLASHCFDEQPTNKFSENVMPKQFHNFTSDHELDGVIDFTRDGDPVTGAFKPSIIWDEQERGLRLYIGKRSATWQWFSESRDHGDRSHTFRTLGKFDAGFFATPRTVNPNKKAWEPVVHRAKWHMGVEAARRQARILSGKIEEGTAGTNAKEGPTFRQAFTGGFKNENGDPISGYLEYLKKTCKPTSRWPYNVERLGEQFLLAKWGDWSLIEMGKRAPAFKEWYLGMIDNPTSANHCARIVRALYRRASAHDHRLPARDPVAVIGKKEWHKERGEQKGLSGSQLPQWYADWQQIPNATHRAYWLVMLLTGARSGELARARWRDLDLENREFTMADAKQENDITVPITEEIIAAFEVARTDPERPNNVGTAADDLIFPGVLNNPTRDKIPARGHALRRTYKTISEDYCGVSSQISEFLEGRMPEGVKGRYLLKWARSEGPKVIEAQQLVSRTIMGLLKGEKLKKAA
jgi:integrase